MTHQTSTEAKTKPPVESSEATIFEADEDRPHAELRTAETTLQVFDFGYTVPDVICRFCFEDHRTDHLADSKAVWLDLTQIDRLIALLQSARLEMIELERPPEEPY